MKQGKSVTDLYSELKRVATAKKDYGAPVHHITVAEGKSMDLDGIGTFDISDVAHGQMAQYTGIGKRFYDALLGHREGWRTPVAVSNDVQYALEPASINRHGVITQDAPVRVSDITGVVGPPLYDVTVNTILHAMPIGEKRLVRTLDGNVRAFLSDSYSTEIDNYDVANVAFQAMAQLGLDEDDIQSCDVTDKYLHIKISTPKLQARVVGDLVQFGFYLRTSEVGLAGLDISSFNMNLACLNGMVGESVFKRRHVGKQLEFDDDGVVYLSDTRQADARARLLKMRDNITTALDEHRVRLLADKMNEKADIKISPQLDKVMEVTRKRFLLHDDEANETLAHFVHGKNWSLWGLSNAITRTAQDRRSYDRASELEATGFRLLMGSKAELEGIAV